MLRPHSALSHLLSGGVTTRPLAPLWAIQALTKVETEYQAAMKPLGLFWTVVIRRNADPTGPRLLTSHSQPTNVKRHMPVLSDAASKMRGLNLVVVVTLLAYVAASLWGGWDTVVGSIAQVGVLGIAAGLCMTLLNTGLRFVRWSAYLRMLGGRVSRLASLKIYVAGFALATTPGGAGEPLVRSIFLKSYGFNYEKTVAAYLSERVSDVMAMVIIATIGFRRIRPGAPFWL